MPVNPSGFKLWRQNLREFVKSCVEGDLSMSSAKIKFMLLASESFLPCKSFQMFLFVSNKYLVLVTILWIKAIKVLSRIHLFFLEIWNQNTLLKTKSVSLPRIKLNIFINLTPRFRPPACCFLLITNYFFIKILLLVS